MPRPIINVSIFDNTTAGPPGAQGIQGLTGPIGPVGPEGPEGPAGAGGGGSKIYSHRSSVTPASTDYGVGSYGADEFFSTKTLVLAEASTIAIMATWNTTSSVLHAAGATVKIDGTGLFTPPAYANSVVVPGGSNKQATFSMSAATTLVAGTYDLISRISFSSAAATTYYGDLSMVIIVGESTSADTFDYSSTT